MTFFSRMAFFFGVFFLGFLWHFSKHGVFTFGVFFIIFKSWRFFFWRFFWGWRFFWLFLLIWDILSFFRRFYFGVFISRFLKVGVFFMAFFLRFFAWRFFNDFGVLFWRFFSHFGVFFGKPLKYDHWPEWGSFYSLSILLSTNRFSNISEYSSRGGLFETLLGDARKHYEAVYVIFLLNYYFIQESRLMFQKHKSKRDFWKWRKPFILQVHGCTDGRALIKSDL